MVYIIGGGTTGGAMAVTVNDVADRALVSISTVSRAFTMPHLVRGTTRERVLQAARDMGYQPNRAARGLITGKTGNIAVVVPDIANPFFSAVLKGVHARAREADHVVFLADTEEDPRLEEELVRAMVKQVDGIILCSSRMSEEQLDRLELGKPTVFLNRRVRGAPAVVMDSSEGTREAVAHLAALGHRRIAYLSGPRESWSSRVRLAGLRPATDAVGLELVELGPFLPYFEGGLQAADLVLASQATAAIAFNDLIAFGVLNRLAVRGFHVPADLSLIGFDNIAMAAMVTPALTTVALPMAAAGRAAVDLLLDRLVYPHDEVGDRAERLLGTHLCVRSSTAPPRGGTDPSGQPSARITPRERN